jgi:hypothetical protein
MKTNCELCSTEIEDDEVERCETCGQDGICNDCLMDHDCEADDGE